MAPVHVQFWHSSTSPEELGKSQFWLFWNRDWELGWTPQVGVLLRDHPTSFPVTRIDNMCNLLSQSIMLIRENGTMSYALITDPFYCINHQWRHWPLLVGIKGEFGARWIGGLSAHCRHGAVCLSTNRIMIINMIINMIMNIMKLFLLFLPCILLK